jgi:hypothetical protein
VTATIELSRQYPWAILPAKPRVDRTAARETADVYSKHFRYLRQLRTANACPPWVLGQELGWIIASPVDVTMGRIEEVQFHAESREEAISVGRMLNRTEIWERETGWFATRSDGWLKLTQFRGPEDRWEAMFLPNGDGTVEWRLGWGARIPNDMFLLIMGLNESELQIPLGIMAAKYVNRTYEFGGLSIAVRPLGPVTVTRGMPIARMVLLHRDTIQATSAEAASR